MNVCFVIGPPVVDHGIPVASHTASSGTVFNKAQTGADFLLTGTNGINKHFIQRYKTYNTCINPAAIAVTLVITYADTVKQYCTGTAER